MVKLARRMERLGTETAFSVLAKAKALEAEGREIILDLRPEDGQYVLSDLTSGPVLFATC